MLTATQKILVQESFATIVPIADDVAALFYGRAIEMEPSLRRLFKEDMTEQRRKLMQIITAAVKGLDHFDQLIPVLQDLGRRHATYGVEDRHYDLGGEALLWTLEKALGKAFTPEITEAWATVYGILTTTMKNAAHQALAAA